jgi:hypothetical protein
MDSTTPGGANNDRLSAAHLEELAASGISPEAATTAGVYTETDPVRIGELLNWNGPAKSLGACLVYRYFNPDGNPMDYHRLKPSNPRTSKKKEDEDKKIKYEGPKGTPNRLYIPPGTRAAVADPLAYLILTEGEKKGLSADCAGFPCVSIPGVWAWQVKRPKGADGKGTGRRELIDDLKGIAWKGRRVAIAFDSDSASNPLVQLGEAELAKALRKAGAVVVVAHLPSGPDGQKQGLDDFLVRNGPDALRQLLSAAATPPADPPGGGEGGEGDGKKPAAADVLVDIALAGAELWHDPTQTGYATVGRRSMAVRGKAFRLWLIARYRAENEGKVPNGEALGSAVNAVEAEAVIDGPEHEAHVRVAVHAGKVYLHLADADDTVIEIDAEGRRECPAGAVPPRPRYVAAAGIRAGRVAGRPACPT